MANLKQVRDEVGAKHVISCSSAWSSQQWEMFGVIEFPDVEASQKCTERNAELEWNRYVHAVTVLGTKWPAEEPTASGD